MLMHWNRNGARRLLGAEANVWDFSTFLCLALNIASCLASRLGDLAGLDYDGFEDAVRPTESDPIRPCLVSGYMRGRRAIPKE